jgi:hypothetical protein
MVRKIKITVKRVIFMLNPRDKVKKPRFSFTASNPTLSALKKKFFTGPLGKTPDKRYDNAEPIIPPIIIPSRILPIFLLAISPPFWIHTTVLFMGLINTRFTETPCRVTALLYPRNLAMTIT